MGRRQGWLTRTQAAPRWRQPHAQRRHKWQQVTGCCTCGTRCSTLVALGGLREPRCLAAAGARAAPAQSPLAAAQAFARFGRTSFSSAMED